MNKIILTSALICLTLFSACNNATKEENDSNSATQTIEHKLGTTEVKQNPAKVVVFDIGVLETFNELGIEVVGAPKNFLPAHLQNIKEDTSIEDVGSVKEANYEKVNALSPNLIIISGRLETAYDELSKIAPTIFLAIDADDYMGSLKKNTLTVAKLFNKEEEAQKKLDKIDEKITEAKSKISEIDNKGLILLYNNGRFSAYGPHSRFGFIHDVLQVKPSVEDLEVAVHGQVVSNEFILKANPDYLFIIDRNKVVNQRATNPEEIENPLIKQTNASKNNKIIYLDPAIWYLSQGGLTSTQEMIDEIANNI